jgi:hypothetical protein
MIASFAVDPTSVVNDDQKDKRERSIVRTPVPLHSRFARGRSVVPTHGYSHHLSPRRSIHMELVTYLQTAFHTEQQPADKLAAGLEAHMEQEWRHFLAGTHGLCTRSGLAPAWSFYLRPKQSYPIG